VLDRTEEQHQILCSLGKSATETLAVIGQALGEESMGPHGCLNAVLGSGQTEKGETGEERCQGDYSQRILPDRQTVKSTYCCDVSWQLRENM
jgi:hypothetical protein